MMAKRDFSDKQKAMKINILDRVVFRILEMLDKLERES